MIEECAGCGMDIQVKDPYKPEYCCDGYMCGCLGLPINPVFCDECERKLFESSEEVV